MLPTPIPCWTALDLRAWMARVGITQQTDAASALLCSKSAVCRMLSDDLAISQRTVRLALIYEQEHRDDADVELRIA